MNLGNVDKLFMPVNFQNMSVRYMNRPMEANKAIYT